MNGPWQAAQKLAHLIGTHSRKQKIDANFSAVGYAATQKVGRSRAPCCGCERI
jgi:hypothetical protein